MKAHWIQLQSGKQEANMVPNATFATKTQLSEMALEAAIELERPRQRGPHFDKLGEFLETIHRQLAEEDGSVFLREEGFYNAYRYALSADGANVHADRKTVLQKLIQLTQEDIRGDSPSLNDLKSFCLHVHEALATDLLEEHEGFILSDGR